MGSTAANLTLYARRNEVCLFTIVVRGIDLAGVDLGMQVRLYPGAPGPVLFLLSKVEVATQEGLYVENIDRSGALPVSTIKVRIAAATMTSPAKVPYPPEVGGDATLAYALTFNKGGDVRTRIYGDFIVVDSAWDSQNAPINRTGGDAGSHRSGSPSEGATFTMGDQIVQVSIDGYEIVRPAIETAAAAAASAEARADTAITSIKAITERIGPDSFAAGGFIGSAGQYVASGGLHATPLVRVEGGQDYRVKANAPGNAWHAWYDGGGGFIAAFRGAASGALDISTHAAPIAARYARFSTATTSLDDTLIVPVAARLAIEQVRDVLEQHPVDVPATAVRHGASTVAAEIDDIFARLGRLVDQQAGILNEVDLQADPARPFYVSAWDYTKATRTVAPDEVLAATRINATQFSVPAGGGAKLAVGGAIVIFGGGRFTSHLVKAIAGDTVTVHGALPAAMATVATMHKAHLDQHLGRHGYNGLADYIVDRVQRYAYKKADPLFSYLPTAASTPSFSDPDIYDLTATTKLIDVTQVGGAGAGGFVDGTTNLARLCQTRAEYYGIGVGQEQAGVYLGRFYVVQDAGAGRGIEITFDAGGVDGFLEIPIAAARVAHSSGAVTEGAVRLRVLADGVTLHDQTYPAGPLAFVDVDFVRAGSITVRMTLADAGPTSARLYGIQAWQKSPKTPMAGFFGDGDVVALLGDSWTQFPIAEGSEVPPLRPDGVTAGDGMQYLSERLRARLAADGTAISTLNFGKGGMTSAWGLYWLDKVLAARPTHCIVNFAINDAESTATAAGTADTSYDFDPVNMWAVKPQSAGGVKGSVTAAEWAANMRAICDRLARAGIKPILLMPPRTASEAQTAGLQSKLLPLIAAGLSA